MSDLSENPSASGSPSTAVDSGQQPGSKGTTRVMSVSPRISDLGDTVVLELLHLNSPHRDGALGRIESYEVLDIIGRGGMGIVFRAFDEKLERDVAIKVISPAMVTAGDVRERFLREARAAAGINHWNVVTIHNVGEHAGFPYLVMEFLGGQSLQQRIKSGVPLPEIDIVKISLQIASGLVAARRQRIIHRDIKPGNIMLDEETDRVKITDFGLARTTFESSDLTQEGGVLGTPSFMSPEQVLGKSLDHRSDLFSLGCVIYAMYVGHSPFRCDSPIATANKVHGESHLSLQEAYPEAPDYIVDLVDRLLQKRPQDRYDSAQEVVDILSRHLARLSQTDYEETQAWTQANGQAVMQRPRNRMNRWSMLLACIVGVTLIFTLGRSFWNSTGAVRARDGNSPSGDSSVPPEVPEKNPLPVESREHITVAATGEADFKSISQALEAAGPGSVIDVTDSGTYDGAILLDDPEKFKGIVLKSSHGATLTAPADLTCLVIAGVDGIKIDGFQILTKSLQHGIEVTGLCPGVTITNCKFRALDPLNNFRACIHLRKGASGSPQRPIMIGKCHIDAGHVAIVLGAHDETAPVKFVHIEESFIQCLSIGEGVSLFMQTPIEHAVIARNIMRSGDCAISMKLNEPSTAVNVSVVDNSFDGFECPFRMDTSHPTQTIRFESNLLINSNYPSVADSFRPLEDYSSWFVNNVWEISPACNQQKIKAVATLESNVPLISRTPTSPDYLKPKADAPAGLPGRYRSGSE